MPTSKPSMLPALLNILASPGLHSAKIVGVDLSCSRMTPFGHRFLDLVSAPKASSVQDQDDSSQDDLATFHVQIFEWCAHMSLTDLLDGSEFRDACMSRTDFDFSNTVS